MILFDAVVTIVLHHLSMGAAAFVADLPYHSEMAYHHHLHHQLLHLHLHGGVHHHHLHRHSTPHGQILVVDPKNTIPILVVQMFPSSSLKGVVVAVAVAVSDLQGLAFVVVDTDLAFAEVVVSVVVVLPFFQADLFQHSAAWVFLDHPASDGQKENYSFHYPHCCQWYFQFSKSG